MCSKILGYLNTSYSSGKSIEHLSCALGPTIDQLYDIGNIVDVSVAQFSGLQNKNGSFGARCLMNWMEEGRVIDFGSIIYKVYFRKKDLLTHDVADLHLL